jgi:hypothetical protein
MPQPIELPEYVVLPTTWKKGLAVLLYKTTVFDEAVTEAIRLTAATEVQHVIFTSTHYVDLPPQWSSVATNLLVQEVVPPVVTPPTP